MGILSPEPSTYQTEISVRGAINNTTFVLEKYEKRLFDIFIVYEPEKGQNRGASVTNAMEYIYEYIATHESYPNKPFLVFESYFLYDMIPKVDSVQYYRRGWGPYTVEKLQALIELGG